MKLNEKTVLKILKKGSCQEVGAFISILAYQYRKMYNISEKDFNKSLKNSFKIIDVYLNSNLYTCIECGHEWEGTTDSCCPKCKCGNIYEDKVQ